MENPPYVSEMAVKILFLAQWGTASYLSSILDQIKSTIWYVDRQEYLNFGFESIQEMKQ